MSVLHCYCATDDTTSLTSSLQCRDCQKLFHPGCLKSGNPSPLEGDLLFEFTCEKCSFNATEQVARLKLNWNQVVQLTLYNLHLLGCGKCGYFRWREHICNFIDSHWTSFHGFSKKKTTKWHGTVAGILSEGVPHLFLSGADELNEPGWWKLAHPHPPSRHTKKAAPKKSKKVVRDYVDVVETNPKKRKGRFSAAVKREARIKTEPQAHQEFLHLKAPNSLLGFDDSMNLLIDEDSPISPLEVKDLEIDPGSMSPGSSYSVTMDKIISEACGRSQEAVDNEQSDSSIDKDVQGEELSTSLDKSSLKTASDNQGDEPDSNDKSEDIICIGKYDERLLLQQLENPLANVVAHNPIAKRLKRKLIVRQLKQERNLPLFDLDAQVRADTETKKLKLTPLPGTNMKLESAQRVLDRYQVVTAHNREIDLKTVPFIIRLMGREEASQDGIISPYTGRVLKAYIWKDVESKPIKLRLLEEIMQHYAGKNPDWQPPPSAPISYCYVQPHHVPAINALCREFFWQGIDVSECLQYPDFCCVALYKKVVIGLTIMLPKSKDKEDDPYISFVFTHPDWRNAGIATFMLFHLINKCTGRDITLHVSATNPALFLYQKLGFKVEEAVLDFYDKYLAEDSKECRHALFLRLNR